MKQTRLQILHLEDHPHDIELVQMWLEEAGLECNILHAQSRAEFQKALQPGVDLILSDYQLPSFNGLEALEMARHRLPDVPFIIFSGTIGEDLAVDCLKHGAADYILKQRPQRLVSAIQHALEEAQERAQRQQAEAKLREQAALLEKAQDAIFACDLQERITFWNPSAERIYGWTAEEAIGRTVHGLLATSDLSQLREALHQVSQRGEWFGELKQVRRDGTPLIVESRWTLLRDGQGQPNAKLIINTDVTEHKKLEAQFLRAQRMGSLGALAGGIAHDLNNVLTPILLGVELLENDIKDPESRDLLATMASCAQRGSQMVKQILSFARGVGGQPGVLSIQPLVEEMARLATDTFPFSIEVQVKISPELPSIIGNATQIHQILLNLCVNARDAMPNGGQLVIGAKSITLDNYPVNGGATQSASGSYLVLSVSDTGYGMSPEVLEKIFEPFFTTKSDGKGTGLGLSTVFGIAKSHNGFVEVSSQVGKGTRFDVYLPAAPKQGLANSPQGSA